MIITTRAKLPKRDLKRTIKNLGSVLAGKQPDLHGIRKVFFAAYAHKFFTLTHKAYIVKSKKGTDDLGVKWKDISPITKARRKLRAGDIGKLKIGGRGENAFKNRTRGLLTKSQDQKWKAIFAAMFKKMANRIGEEEAKQRAAKIAWSILKKEGAKTKIGTLGKRNLPIGIDTHELEESLRPGTVSGRMYYAKKGQVYKVGTDNCEIGTAVEHAKGFHKHRPIWPSQQKRKKWDSASTEAGKKAVLKFLKNIV